MPRIGFFGKLPAKGDFLTRALPADALAVWEKWLASSMAGARQHLGQNWGAVYERAPVWRFWIGGRVTGHAMTGALAPSVDRVGRQFPLSFVLTGRPEALPAAPLAGSGPDPWYDALDRAAMEGRHPRFDGDLDGLLERLPLPSGPRQAVADDSRAAFFAYGEAGLSQLMKDVRDHDHQLVANGRSYWWTAGNDFTGPAMVALNGMPDARGFAALLQGFGPPVRRAPQVSVDPAGWEAPPPAAAPPPTPAPPADMGWAATIPPTDVPETMRGAQALPDAALPDAVEEEDASPFDADGRVRAPEAPVGADDPWAAALAADKGAGASKDRPSETSAPSPDPADLPEPRPETSPISDPWKIAEPEEEDEATASGVPSMNGAEGAALDLPGDGEGAPDVDENIPGPEDENEGGADISDDADTPSGGPEGGGTSPEQPSVPDAPPSRSMEDAQSAEATDTMDGTPSEEERVDAAQAAPPLPEEDSPFGRPEDVAPARKPLRGLFSRRDRR